jgi:hypothetical protein
MGEQQIGHFRRISKSVTRNLDRLTYVPPGPTKIGADLPRPDTPILLSEGSWRFCLYQLVTVELLAGASVVICVGHRLAVPSGALGACNGRREREQNHRGQIAESKVTRMAA